MWRYDEDDSAASKSEAGSGVGQNSALDTALLDIFYEIASSVWLLLNNHVIQTVRTLLF